MRHVALASLTALLAMSSLAAQQPGGRLGRAMDSIDRNDVTALRQLLREEPALVRRTEAGVLPHWRWTLLHSATAGSAGVAIVALLIDAGAEVNVKDNEGNTPLHFAMKRIGREKLPAQDYDAIIRLLLERKADVHAVNLGGATPLHTASAFRADPSGVELLIQAGAIVNAKAAESFGGWTPLHGAAARNSDAIVATLLKHGADRSARDAKGLTALEVAEQGGFLAAARALRLTAPAPATTSSSTPNVVAPPANVPVPPAAGRPTSTSGLVQGRVLWNGQPVAGATVYVADDFTAGSVRYGTVTTDEQGRFSISGVPEGNKYVGVSGNQRVFWITGGTPFAMTGSGYTRDFHLCKGFDPASPAMDEIVSARPVLRWEPYPDAVRYVAVVMSADNRPVFSRGYQGQLLKETSVEVDVALASGTYQWRVSAFNAAGQEIGCSYGPRRFMVRFGDQLGPDRVGTKTVPGVFDTPDTWRSAGAQFPNVLRHPRRPFPSPPWRRVW